MASLALTDAFAYVDGYDFTCDANRLNVESSVAELDVSTFCSPWRQVTGGLRSTSFQMGGFWQSATVDAVDPELFPNLGAQGVVTFGPTETEGDPAYLFRARRLNYQFLGTHGEAAPFTLGASGSDGQGVDRGALAKAKGTVDATGALGTGVQLGDVAAGEYLYASFHVFPTAGTTITVVVESDDNGAFSSATTRATIGPLTATGGTWIARVAGPITDTHYRFRVTAITGTFLVAGAIGIG